MDHRTDRKQQFLLEMAGHGIEKSLFLRVAGVIHDLATLGASKAWLKAFEECYRSGKRLCCMFDDDFIFVAPYKNNTFLARAFFYGLLYTFPFQFDAVFLSGAYKHPLQAHTHVDSGEPNIFRAKAVFGASAVCMPPSYVEDVIVDNVKEGIRLQEAHYELTGASKPEFTIDFFMRKLQSIDNWFAVKVGMQRPTYSDIEKKMVMYEW